MIPTNRTNTDDLHRICHELRRPLAVIHAYAELLEDEISGPLTAEQRGQVRTVLGASDKLSLQIQNLVSLAEIDNGELVVVEQDVELGRLVTRLARQFKPRFFDLDMGFEVNLADDPIPLWTDAARLETALGHLLENALQYGAAQGTVQLHFDAAPSGAGLRLFVEGEPFTESECELIFERYHRLSGRAGALEDKGMGVGLTIVQANLQALGGRCWASPVPGQGNTFHIELPAT